MGRTSVYGISELAEQAGVSTATVSRVLNNHPGVSERSRAKVLRLMKESKTPTRALGRPMHVLVVVGSTVESFVTETLVGIARYTHENRATAEFAFDPKTRADLDFIRFLRERRCDGVLDLCRATGADELAALSKLGIPVMAIGEKMAQAHAGYVMIDSREGAGQVVDYLCALGHQEIFFLANGRDPDSDLALRRDGFVAAMRRHGLPVHDRRVVEHVPDSDTQKSGYAQTLQLLAQSPEATAIVASTDEMAYGAMKACREHGLSVPGDISIVGFDDYRHSAYWNPGLTTLKQPLEAFGYDAMKELDLFINGFSKELSRTVKPGELIIRDSCAPPRNLT